MAGRKECAWKNTWWIIFWSEGLTIMSRMHFPRWPFRIQMCIRDSAMGLYQTSMACANTQLQNAMRVIGEQIDTSSILVDIDAYNSQSEGAGAGYRCV